MDHRKTKVQDLNTLNKYIKALDLAYEMRVIEDRMCFVGVDRLGNASGWVDNNFPITLLKKITYADWVDMLFAVSNSNWSFDMSKKSKKY